MSIIYKNSAAVCCSKALLELILYEKGGGRTAKTTPEVIRKVDSSHVGRKAVLLCLDRHYYFCVSSLR